MGKAHEGIAKNPERKIATVCGECNNGWMSVLENKHIPLISSMFPSLLFRGSKQVGRLVSYGLRSAP